VWQNTVLLTCLVQEKKGGISRSGAKVRYAIFSTPHDYAAEIT
jgi:hypothetical protein